MQDPDSLLQTSEQSFRTRLVACIVLSVVAGLALGSLAFRFAASGSPPHGAASLAPPPALVSRRMVPSRCLH